MTFHVSALEATQAIFDGETYDAPEAYSAACDRLQAKLRESDEFATVQMSHDPIDETFTVMIDRAPESVKGFEGQSERLYVTYKMLEGEPLKYKTSRPE